MIFNLIEFIFNHCKKHYRALLVLGLILYVIHHIAILILLDRAEKYWNEPVSKRELTVMYMETTDMDPVKVVYELKKKEYNDRKQLVASR